MPLFDRDAFAAAFLPRLDQRPQPQLHVLQQLGKLGGLAGTQLGGQLGRDQGVQQRLRRRVLAEIQLEIQRHRGRLLVRLTRLQDDPRREIGLAKRRQPLGDFLPRAEQHHGPPQADHVAGPQPPELDGLAVDLGAVGAFQVGQHQLALVFLDFQMEAADPLVVELDGVSLLAADSQGGRNILENASPVSAVQNSQGNSCHGALPILLPFVPRRAEMVKAPRPVGGGGERSTMTVR